MVTRPEDVFPQLAGGNHRITSPSTWDYNCIAWAAGDSSQWWWPGPNVDDEHWPAGIPREATLAAFQAAFATLAYEICQGEEAEPGFEKIAIFATDQGKPTHAARQLGTGRWTSKLGPREDIEHELHDLEGAVYGKVVVIMKRPRAASAKPTD